MEELDVRIKKALREIDSTLKKYKLSMTQSIVFPQKKIPLLSKLCLFIISKQGGRLDIDIRNTR